MKHKYFYDLKRVASCESNVTSVLKEYPSQLLGMFLYTVRF